MIGATDEGVQSWKAGKYRPRAYYRARLAELFGVSLEELSVDQ